MLSIILISLTQEIIGAKKFRRVGIKPSICSKFDRIFNNIVATGQFVWIPSTRVLFDDGGGDDDVGNVTDDDDMNLEGENDNQRRMPQLILLMMQQHGKQSECGKQEHP